MNRQTTNTKGLLGATSRMMVAFILLVAGLGFASVAQAQLSASGPPILISENCGTGNGAVDPGENVGMNFTVTNNTGTAAVNVLVTLQASGHVIGPTPSFQVISVPAHSTAGVNFNFTASGLCGVDQVIPTLAFAGGASGTATFPGLQLGATVSAPHNVSNPSFIAIPGSGTFGPSSPNPSTIPVSGISGTVGSVKLNLLGFSHQFPDDLMVLLVGPKGQSVLVMDDAGGNFAIPGNNTVSLTFDDNAAGTLPDEGQIVSGSFKVSQYGADSEVFPNPAPSGPYSANLAVFNGQDPNGTWSLYINDDQAGGTGSLASGWSLDISTTTITCCQGAAVPEINNNAGIPDATTQEDTTTQFTITLSDDVTAPTNLVVTVTGNTNQVLVPNNNISISVIPNSAQRSISITPAANQNGKTEITFTVTDTDGFSSAAKLELTVTSLNDNPTVSSIASQGIPMNGATGAIPFTVNDLETPADQLQVLASSSNTGLVPNNKIVLGGSGNNRTIQITANTNLVGSTTITVQVADLDGGTTSTSFTLQVGIQQGPPFISSVSDQNSNEDVPISAGISIGDDKVVDQASADALFAGLSGTSSNQGLVPNNNITFSKASPNSASSPLVTITPVANQFGTTTITLTVRDSDGNTASTTFKATFGSLNDAPILNLSNIKPATLVINGNGDVTGTINEDFAVTSDLTVDDVESGTSGVTVTTSSSDTTLVPNANVLISGSGSARKLTIIPAANLYSGIANVTQPSVTITITANDNSGLPNNITTHTLNFTVLPVNDPPQFTKGPDISVSEDQGGSFVGNWSPKLDPGAANESGQTVSLFVTSVSNPGLFTVQPSFSGNNLTFTPGPNQDGSALITVVAKDNGGTANGGNDTSAPQSFLITVVGINDQPSFNLAITATTLPEDTLGVVTTSPLVTNIDPGAGGAGSEGSQTLTFVISNNHPEFFKTQPSIKINGSTGDLSYELATNANGTATLQIKLVDNGGTVNGGVDTSVTQNLDIIITAIDDPPTISTIANVTTGKNKDSGVTLFTVNDPDITNQGSLAVAFAHVSGANLAQLPPSLGVSGGTRALIITPITGLTGLPLTETLSATVVDVNQAGPGPLPAATTTFTFTVTDLNNPPTISPATLPDITAVEDAPSIASPTFTVNDVETVPASLLNVTATSSDQTIVLNSGIFIANGVNPGDRIAIITPVANAATTNGVIITVTVTDQQVPPGTGALAAQSTSKSFKLFLTPVNDSPTIAASPNTSSALKKSTQEDVPVVIPFTVTDPEDLNNLTFLLTSTNQALVKDANIVLGGTNNNRNVTVTPELNASGVTDISIGVRDPSNAVTNFVIFSLTVNPVNDPPTIIGGLPPTQSISENQTLTLTFDIADVETPANLLVLTSASGDTSLVPASGIVFDTSAAYTNVTRKVKITPLANKSGSALITISITDNGVAGPPSLPAVTANFQFTLNVGSVDTPPTITPIADITITKNSTSQGLAFTIGDAETDVTQLGLSTVVGASPSDLIAAGGIAISGTGASRTIKVTPAPGKIGTAVITITVTDSIGQTANSSFTVNVTDVNTAPTIGKIADQVTTEDTDTALIPFVVGDAESVNSLTLSATSSNPLLVPDQNVFFGGSGINRALFVTPAPNEPLKSSTNITFITVTVSDGQFTASTSFKLTVNPVNDVPTISAIPNQSTKIGQAITGVKFVVSDVETGAAFLSVVPTSSNQQLVANGSIFLSGTGTNRTLSIFPAANQSGQTLITVTATDDQGASAKTQFLVIVGGLLPGVPNDFNTDGNVDIVFQADDGSVGVWFMVGPDLVSASLFNPGNVGDLGWRIVGTGDFNGDAKTDLLFQHTDGSLGVWLLNGIDLASAQLVTPSTAGPGWSVVATGDVNKDGKTDIIFQHADGTLAVWMMNGTTLVDGQLFNPSNPGTGWRVVGSGDFTGVGSTDLVFQHTDGTLAVWYMDGLNLIQGTLLNPDNPGDSDWRVAGTVDLNKDGKTDLLFQHADGSVATWLLDGINLSVGELLNPSNPGAGWKLVGPK